MGIQFPMPNSLCVCIALTTILFAQPFTCLDVRRTNDDCVVVEYGSQALSRIDIQGNRILLYGFREGSWPRSVAVDSMGNYIVTEGGVNRYQGLPRTVGRLSCIGSPDGLGQQVLLLIPEETT